MTVTHTTMQTADPDADGRIAALDLSNGDVALYDRENHAAWIQSDVCIPQWSDDGLLNGQ